MFHSHSIFKLTFPTPSTFPSKATELYNPKCILRSVCRFCVSFTYVVESIESKLNSVCLINDHSLIADLHIFVNGRTECATTSLECTKGILLISNNFGTDNVVRVYLLINVRWRHLIVSL